LVDSRARLSLELRGWLDAVLEGNLDPSQQTRLRELLLGDSEFRRAYVEHMSMVAGVRHYLAGRDSVERCSSTVGQGALPPQATSQVPGTGRLSNGNVSNGQAVGAAEAEQSDPAYPLRGEAGANDDGGSGSVPPSAPLAPAPVSSAPIATPPIATPPIAPAPIAPAPMVSAPSSSNPRLPGLLGFAVGGLPWVVDLALRPVALLLIVATCSLSAVLILLPLSRISERAHSAGSVAAPKAGVASAGGASVLARPDAFVARIVQVSPDVVWGEPSVPMDFCLRARPGDKLSVVEGLVEIEFYSGAKIILHGPSVFTPTGPMAGRLESGRLTGQVSNGNFRLMTPTAEVIDLGTEFGVTADAKVGTDVVVFNGRVQVVSRPDGPGSQEVLNMTEGMAARFRSDGTTEFGVTTEACQFARDVRQPATPDQERIGRDEVCLIDILSGGDGTGKGLAGAVDPTTGLRDYGEHGRKSLPQGRWGDGLFHGVAWHPMIDGVFVPASEGLQVQIDSLGHKVDLPANCGATYGSIWARRRESALEPNSDVDNDFWGARTLRGIVERLMVSRRGLVGIHANAGMTFDLRTLRMVHRRPPIEFRAAVANVENSKDWAPDEMPDYKRTVDFRVFVDGVLRFARLGFRREDGDGEFSIALSPDDRFLTVVVTDDGGLAFDHAVLVDPIIVLQKK
jgi:hypothetical protein